MISEIRVMKGSMDKDFWTKIPTEIVNYLYPAIRRQLSFLSTNLIWCNDYPAAKAILAVYGNKGNGSNGVPQTDNAFGLVFIRIWSHLQWQGTSRYQLIFQSVDGKAMKQSTPTALVMVSSIQHLHHCQHTRNPRSTSPVQSAIRHNQ